MTDAEQFLADLEANAKAATLEEWREGTVILSDGSIVSAVVTVDGDEICNTGQSLLHDVFNAAYIAAANPAAVLRLVGMVRELQAEVERREKEADWLGNRLNNTFINQCCFCRDGIKQHTVKCQCTKTWRDIARKAVEEEA